MALVLATALLVAGCARSVTGSAAPVVGVTGLAPGSLTSFPTDFNLTPGTTSAGTSPTGDTGTPSPPVTATPSTAGTGPATSIGTPRSTAVTAGTAASSSATTTYRTSWPLGPKVTAAPKNQYGDLRARPGQVFSLTWTDSHQDVIAFVVDSIVVDKGCAPGTGRADNGHFVVLTMRIEVRNATLKEITDSNIDLSKSHWTAYDAKGMAQTGVHSTPADTCVQGHEVPVADELAVGSANPGRIAFDVTSPKGTVVLNISGIKGGWEYQYG